MTTDEPVETADEPIEQPRKRSRHRYRYKKKKRYRRSWAGLTRVQKGLLAILGAVPVLLLLWALSELFVFLMLLVVQ
jgi:hypothetical protein